MWIPGFIQLSCSLQNLERVERGARALEWTQLRPTQIAAEGPCLLPVSVVGYSPEKTAKTWV